uniref:Palmitoyltransferase n=1 Tax=Vannella robusta TaxID=1487602 RepID=A0A7S4HZU8_9EUKA
MPLFIDTINTFIPIGRLVHVYLSRFLIIVLAIQYVASIYYYFTMVIPYYSESATSLDVNAYRSLVSSYEWTDTYQNWESWSFSHQFWVVFGACIALWLWMNTIFSYFQTVRYSPLPLPPVELTEEEIKQNRNYCQKCKIIKKPATHHCSQCGRCVENMDHHCPFTGNCVTSGKTGNFVFFFLFIFYTAAGCFLAVSTMTLPFYNCYLQRELSPRCVAVGNMSLIYIPGLLLLFATGGFTLLHLLLAFFGRSTLEFLAWLDGHDTAATAPAQQHEMIDIEHQKLQEINKLHCSPFQFLFPYAITIVPKNKPQ